MVCTRCPTRCWPSRRCFPTRGCRVFLQAVRQGPALKEFSHLIRETLKKQGAQGSGCYDHTPTKVATGRQAPHTGDRVDQRLRSFSHQMVVECLPVPGTARNLGARGHQKRNKAQALREGEISEFEVAKTWAQISSLL